ncbi:Cupin domain-containing protein [Desulfonispora thiosulfatigenes DSM 11270]|uniref:Cupin domain-containing protein n=1 Tax=Desulfonispora thiosulfatigenes DSM 11270 TaxID=656914 RepID=A0A1W1UF82_DESTI|nr:cupin domain-containing protein [Desulfonispora thiosulfatigenes]SMB79746.1 Cupin domain-containing protein [Desulfonispora thiosulfatigenes DSM 11270]
MIVSHSKDVQGINNAGNENVLKKVLISPEVGWKDYVMRLFELSPGKDACSLRHSHEWPHIVYIVEGKGIIHLDGADNEVKAGSFAYIPGGKIHQFVNNSSEKFSFLCIVPPEGDV